MEDGIKSHEGQNNNTALLTIKIRGARLGKQIHIEVYNGRGVI